MKFDDFHVFFWCRSRNYLQLVKNRNNREMIFKKKKKMEENMELQIIIQCS